MLKATPLKLKLWDLRFPGQHWKIYCYGYKDGNFTSYKEFPLGEWNIFSSSHADLGEWGKLIGFY